MSLEPRISLFHEFPAVDVVAVTMIDGFGAATGRAYLAGKRPGARSNDDAIPTARMDRARETAQLRLADARRIGARCLIDGDPEYPDSLHSLEHPPLAIWTLGNLDLVHERPAVAIVGTRDCSAYGERVTRDFAGAFARAGATVVSGMAVGIDAAAHVAALDVGGSTVAVLGTGVDVPYPVRHRGLHRQIRDRGLVISESPPGTNAGPGCFPRRNRIIAALGQATIVVEAGVKSGALNTAEHTQAIDRKLGVVPGPIDSPRSLGSNMLMRDGGHPITCVADALAMIGLSQASPRTVTLTDGSERKVWSALSEPAADFDVLCARTGLPARVCIETVGALELRGLVECALTGELRRR